MIKLRIEVTCLNRSLRRQKQRVLCERVDYFDDDVSTFISDFGDANDSALQPLRWSSGDSREGRSVCKRVGGL